MCAPPSERLAGDGEHPRRQRSQARVTADIRSQARWLRSVTSGAHGVVFLFGIRFDRCQRWQREGEENPSSCVGRVLAGTL